MSSLEKRAWFQLAVVASATAAWFVLFSLFHSIEAAMAAFGLLGLSGLPGPNQARAVLDERDQQISDYALNTAVRCWFVLSTLVPLALGVLWGWEQSVSVGIMAQGAWLAWSLILIVRSAVTIYLYRSVRYAA